MIDVDNRRLDISFYDIMYMSGSKKPPEFLVFGQDGTQCCDSVCHLSSSLLSNSDDPAILLINLYLTVTII